MLGKNIAEKLRKARALVAQPRGWVKGTFKFTRYETKEIEGATYAYCTIGAMREAAGQLSLIDPPPGSLKDYHEMQRIFKEATPEIKEANIGIEVWNDRVERTQEDVVAAFDRAIVLAEQKGV